MKVVIPIIEEVISQIIDSRLKYLKANVDIVDRIFSTATLTSRNRLKEYITSSNIKILRGFPRDQTQLPAYVILLGGEREQEENLGTFMDDDEDNFTTATATETKKAYRQGESYIIQTTKKPIFSVQSIAVGGMTYQSPQFTVLDSEKGIVQINVPVQTYDDVTINFTVISTGNELYGTMFNCQYRVETWTNNGDLTVLLYHLLKWIFISARDDLVNSGLVRQTLGGMDFEPAPEYFPEFVYRRAMTFEVFTEISVNPDDGFPYISTFEDDSTFG